MKALRMLSVSFLTLLLACVASCLVGCTRGTSDKDVARIQGNLSAFYDAGLQFMLETGKPEAAYSDLVGPDRYLKEVKAVNGEDYRSLKVSIDVKSLSVRSADGREITFVPR